MNPRTWYIVLLLTILLSLAIAALYYHLYPEQKAAGRRHSHVMQAPTPPVAAMPKAAASPAAPAVAPDLVLDLFEPTPESLDAQHRTTLLRNQLEQALSITFLLTHCQLLTNDEYGRLYNRFAQVAVTGGLSPDYTTAERDMRALADAAGASYALVYSRVPCDDPSLPQTLASLRHWEAQADAVATVSDNSSTP